LNRWLEDKTIFLLLSYNSHCPSELKRPVIAVLRCIVGMAGHRMESNW
jgi:hypothetical protein